MEQETVLTGRHILVIEDDREIAELITTYLRKESAAVENAFSAEEALFHLRSFAPELVVLDLGLPGADGLDFLRVFRETSSAPVIIVSARESDEDKIEGLGLGADDFVSKPFSPRVLMARVKAQLRRSTSSPDTRTRLSFGPYTIDFSGNILEKSGRPVPLSHREFEILSFLARSPFTAFRTEELYRAVWGTEFGDLTTVAVHIQRIRRKIETDPSRPRWIRTVPGSGYRFVPEGAVP